MKVLLLGATGLVGEHCLKKLIASPKVKEVIAPTRRILWVKDQRVSNPLIDFDRLDEYPELFEVDAIFCCLGTTMRQAGSRRNFLKVDFQYCMDAAELGRAAGVQAMLLVSAVGASHRSPWFYSRVKGQLEDHLKELEFPWLSIYRPSLLIGSREQLRLGEHLMGRAFPYVAPVLQGPLKSLQGIEGEVLAQAMVNEVINLDYNQLNHHQVNVYTYADIVRLSEKSVA